MLEAQEWRGVWWDPSHRDEAVGGVLAFSQERSELELIGALGGSPIVDPFELGDHPRIHGVTTDGRKVTLDGCMPRGRQIGGVPVERYFIGTIFVGHHLEGEIAFDSLSVRFTHLDMWAGLSGFNEEIGVDDNGSLGSLRVEFRPPDPVRVSIHEDLEMEVGFGWNWSGRSIVTTRSEIEQRAGVTLRFPQPRRFSEAAECAGRIRNFLSLATGAPVHPVEITASVGRDVQSDSGLENERTRVTVYYMLGDEPDPTDLARTVWPHQMRFILDESFAARIRAWLSRYDVLRPTLNLYFGVSYGAMRYVEPRFLSLAQALETYHRRTTTTTLLPPEEHQQWLGAILASAPAESRARVASLLEHANELRLRQRVRDLLTRCPQVVAKLASDQKRFLQDFLDARNYLTHYDRALEERAPGGVELVLLATQVSALIEMCLFLEIGFTCDEIDAIFDRVRRYEEIAHLREAAAGS